jgi:hypothetical protein
LKKSFIIYFCVKVFYILFGVLIFSRVSNLGDSDRYASADVELSSDALLSRTQLIDLIAGTITKVFRFPFFSHLFFTIISFYGIYYCLSRLKCSKNTLIGILIMLSLPSFAMWTSVAGKEAFTVFTTGVIMGALFDAYYKNKVPNKILCLVCILFSLLLRPHYTIGLIAFFLFVYVTKNLEFKPFSIFISFVLIFVVCTFLYYSVIKPFIDDGGFIQLAWAYFNGFGDAGAARNADYWKVSSDYYSKMFEGSFIALIGPTFFDSIKRPVYFPFFFESMAFVSYICYYLFSAIKLQIRKNFFSQYFFFAILFVFILTSVMHYPFGVFNSGSALRYRSAFYHIFIIIPVFLYNFIASRGIFDEISNSETK